MKPPSHPLARLPLRAAASLYGAVVRARNRYYDRPGSGCRAAVPVLSVGNLTLGGTGKTPLVHWLARQLIRAGHKPAIVSRGYGGTAGRGPRTVSLGEGPTCSAAECGDEPYLLASTLPDVPVVVGSDRCAGAAEAVALGAGVILLDDGFQHRRIARDLDIVLLDATVPFGNGQLLPAGVLREPPDELARADLVLITRSRREGVDDGIERAVRRYNGGVPILRSGHRRLGFRNGQGRSVGPPRRALVFCGIGNPEAFRADVEAESVEVAAFEPRRDHHVYDRTELERLRERAAALDAALVTTEKDRVRLPEAAPPLLTLAIEAEPYDAQTLLDVVERALEGSAAC